MKIMFVERIMPKIILAKSIKAQMIELAAKGMNCDKVYKYNNLQM